MNYQDIKDKYFNKKFLVLCIIIFIFLYIFCTFIKFLGQIPILLLLTIIIAYYLYNMLNKKNATTIKLDYIDLNSSIILLIVFIKLSIHSSIKLIQFSKVLFSFNLILNNMLLFKGCSIINPV